MFETPRIESLDIDDQEGWDIAETIARQRLRPITEQGLMKVLVTCPPMLRASTSSGRASNSTGIDAAMRRTVVQTLDGIRRWSGWYPNATAGSSVTIRRRGRSLPLVRPAGSGPP